MNRKNHSKIAKDLAHATSTANKTEAVLMQSVEAAADKKAKEDLAKTILTAMEEAESVEELVYIERTLQTLDREKAVTEQDKTSIANAERDYAQIVKTIEQMRKSPAEYFDANLSIREVGGDFKKMPRSRGLQQISGNKARMQNRSSFAPENDRNVWDARIALADKTVAMLRAYPSRPRTLISRPAANLATPALRTECPRIALSRRLAS